MTSTFSKTSYSAQSPNVNNFLATTYQDPENNQKRTSSALNQPKTRNENSFNPFSRKLKQSPYYSKQVQKRFPMPASKPIIGSFRRSINQDLRAQLAQSNEFGMHRVNNSNVFQQTASHFGPSTASSKKNPRAVGVGKMFAETATDGFLKIQRPMSKQQPRPKGTTVLRDPQQSLDVTSNYIESDVQEADEQDRDMIQDIENDSLFLDRLDLNQRPQTSKGFRRKSNASDIPIPADDEADDLLDFNERPPCRKKLDFELAENEQLKIPIRSMYVQNRHENKGYTSTGFKKKKVEDLIKFNVSTIKKSESHGSVPFESSIGADFLSLFANSSSQS